MQPVDLPTRIVAEGVFQPDEYDCALIFTGWETESGTPADTTGWDLVVIDEHHKVEVNIRFSAHNQKVTTSVEPLTNTELP